MTKISNILEITEKMPFFMIENMAVMDCDKKYLKILLSRLKINNQLFRIKRGIYVSSDYIEKLQNKGVKDDYLEFIACKIYEPAYLSAEYVLSKYGILSESVFGYSLISANKTYRIINDFGVFTYHFIKKELFIGYLAIKKGEFLIFEASLAKALFDFLYLRKNSIGNFAAFQELRLNLQELKKKEIKEFKKYIILEGSKKMAKIYFWLLKAHGEN